MTSANVVNTSVIPTATVSAPYYDDWDEKKGYHKLIFRPEYAVQARELTQIQTALQIQVERLGRHIFSEGSVVTGGQLSLDKAISLNLENQYVGTDINTDNFIGQKIIYGSGNNQVQAQVVSAQNATAAGEPPTLMIKYLSGDEFTAGDTIMVDGQNIFANVAATNPTANGLTASVADGVYFVSGYFVLVPRQTIILSKYSTTPDVRIGLEIADSIIDENQDSTLFDPALGAGNYQGPGSTRYQIDLVLATRDFTSTDTQKFIELTRVKGGVLQTVINIPIYSDIEDTLARRTYDESGSYTVKTFKLDLLEDSANSSNVIVRLDPGKAYIFGYEFETVVPTDFSIERTRDYNTDPNYNINLAYGNYLNMSNFNGTIDISSMPVADIHCVPWEFANNSNATTYGATKIGTTRIRNIVYYTASNTSNGQTYQFSNYIFDTRLSAITGNATGGSANTIQLNLPGISANNGAYNGVGISITKGTSSGDSRTIVYWNGTTKTATVDTNFTTSPDSSSQFSLNFSIDDAESLVIGTPGGTLTCKQDIDISCKDTMTANGNTYIKEPTYSSLVFPFPTTFIKDGLTGNNYRYRKVFTGRSFTAGVGTVTVATGEDLVGTGTLSATQILDHYMVMVTNAGTSGLVAGQIVSFTQNGASVSVSGSTATFNANLAGDFTADVIVDVDINTGSETNAKIKTQVNANTTYITTGASDGSFISSAGANATVYLADGQVIIQNPNRVATLSDKLYISDATAVQIFDLNGSSIVPGSALSNYTDVTSKYTFDNGQRDTIYDFAAIVLKNSVNPPKGPLVVCVDYYNHGAGTSDGYGFFSVDSYPNSSTTGGYVNIPYYTDNRGNQYRLSDVIDFRPKRLNASNTTPNYTLQGIRIPKPNEDFVTTYNYYLSRKDYVYLSRNRVFLYEKGVSSINPVPQNDPTDGMILYRLNFPPFVMYPSNVNVEYIENKRYTMRDIGKLETRIQNLEYYQTLSILEKSATDLSITDVNGLERTKYGIIADSFTGHQFGDVTNPDYRCSIDFVNNQLRPFFKQNQTNMVFKTGDTNYAQGGTNITLKFNEVDFIVQNLASKSEAVEYYLIASYDGHINLIPDGDIWVDTNQLPDVIVNNTGANDAWESLAGALNASEAFGTEWNDWQTHWTGSQTVIVKAGHAVGGSGVTVLGTELTGTQTRTGIQTQLNFDTINQNLGKRVVDVSIVPYIRPAEVDFLGVNLRPTRRVYYFFDSTPITDYIQKPNILKLTGNTSFIDTPVSNEWVNAGSNTGKVLLSQVNSNGNTVLYLSHSTGTFIPGQTITGSVSGNTGIVLSYDHYSGNATGGSISTINLALGAANTDNYYSGNTIYIVTGSGWGQNSVIQTYNGATQVATVSPSFSISPTTNTKYSIGVHKTNEFGDITGTFMIPSTDTVYFRTGQRNFRIIDNDTDDIDNYTTKADAQYTAQGLIQTTDSVILSTQVPELTQKTVSETQQVSVITKTWNWDPMAETFDVDENAYPNGVFLSSVQLFFKAKDDTLPVWIEIRPTVNGFPDASKRLPSSQVILYPNEVNISDNPSYGNNSTATTFTFPTPIYLAPGQTYALICQTNSLNYEVYIGELGKPRIGSNELIASQPYSGSLFKSQNASVWTPFQFEDLMFVLRRADFTTTPSTIYFENIAPSSNILMDWMYVQTNALILANTKVSYGYEATLAATMSKDSAYTDFNGDTNIRLDSGTNSGRKILSNIKDGDLNVRVTLSTLTSHISPVVDISRYGVIGIQNWINNANLSNTNIVLSNNGIGYVGTNVSVTISGGSALTTANAYVANVTGGQITSIIMDAGGSYYTGKANISFSGGGATMSATANIASELDPSGGPALTRYITKKVTLNEGFNASDLRVYLTAYKPVGTDIEVYFKIKNENDADKFDNKPYIRMAQITPSNRFSSSKYNEDDMIEYEYHADAINDFVTYSTGTTTYTTFNEFAIKIVLLSDDTIVVPIVQNMRAIALPSG